MDTEFDVTRERKSLNKAMEGVTISKTFAPFTLPWEVDVAMGLVGIQLSRFTTLESLFSGIVVLEINSHI